MKTKNLCIKITSLMLVCMLALYPLQSFARENIDLLSDNEASEINDIEMDESLPKSNQTDEVCDVKLFADDENAENLETEENDDYRDENGYITSTYGYTLKGDPYVDDREIYSFYGSAVYDLNGGTNGTPEMIEENRETSFYNMSDRFFFGEWDEEEESWITEGKINYAGYPELAGVEEFVKVGDYESAKNEYYLYYLQKERNGARPRNTVTNTASRIQAELLTKNFMYNHISGFTPLALFEVKPEPEWHSVDVTSTVSSNKGTMEELTFWVIATDKDGGMAEFASRETGETAPKLRVIVNGAQREYNPVADTYISAGANDGKYFGFEDTLKASESHTADEYMLVDANTNRVYIKFDVSDLKTSDTISAATLELYGSNTSDNGKNKETVVFYSADSAWDETLTNYKVPSLIFSYDQIDSWLWVGPGTRQVDWGSRYMEELLRFSGWFGNLVGMYNVTGDEKYAYTVLRILMDYLHVCGMHTRYMKDLDIGVRCSSITGPFMQLLESKYMTPDIFTAFMKYMWIEGNEFMQFFTSDMNWGVMERAGHYNIAVEFPEFTDSEKWIEDIRRCYKEVTENVLYDDGSCYELALGYVWTTVTSPISSYALPKQIGIENAPSPLDEETIEILDKLVEFMMFSSMPGYRDHQEGDSNSFANPMSGKFLEMYNLSGNQTLLYGATNGREGVKPDFTSCAWLGVGNKAAMRTDWDEDALYLYASVDGSQGNHGHADDCNVMVHAYGQYLLVDPLYGTYSGTNASYWLKSSEAHNVVTVNGNDHVSSDNVDITAWETNKNYDFVAMRSANAKGADNYERTVLFVKPGFWIVNDYLEPTNKDESNSYSQTWHFLPEANPEIDKNTKVISTNFNKANIKVVPVDADKFSNAGLKSGWASSGMGSISQADYGAYEKRLSGNAVFNTILYPEKIGEASEIRTETIKVGGLSESQASAYDLYITNTKTGATQRYQYYQRHDEAKEGTYTVGSLVTDASLLLAELDSNGKAINIIARDASYISNKDTGKIVWQSDTPVQDLSVKYEGNMFFVDSSGIDSDFLADRNVFVSKPHNDIEMVFVNNEKTNFETTANYIYFGIAPNDDEEESEDESTQGGSSRPSGSSNGGSSGGKIHGSSGTAFISSPSVPVTPVIPPSNNENKVLMNDEMKAEIKGHWAENEITNLFEKGIIKGVSDTSVGADASITRAEFITLLIRTLNIDPVEYRGTFDDVTEGQWYADYLQAAFDNGIMHGSDGNALPENLITREEMAKLICTSAEKLSLSLTSADLSGYDDFDKISPWAIEYVEKVVASKIMTGRTNVAFCPTENALRAEAFVLIYRLLDSTKK